VSIVCLSVSISLITWLQDALNICNKNERTLIQCVIRLKLTCCPGFRKSEDLGVLLEMLAKISVSLNCFYIRSIVEVLLTPIDLTTMLFPHYIPHKSVQTFDPYEMILKVKLVDCIFRI